MKGNSAVGKAKKFAVGAAVAAAAGYVAGILTAPKSGRETRNDIQDKAVGVKRETERELKKLHTELSDLIEQGKASSAKLTAKGKQDWQKALKAANDSRDKVKSVLSTLHDEVVDDKDLKKAIKEAGKAVEYLNKYIQKHRPKK